MTYAEVRGQLHARTHSFQNAEDGLLEFTIGLALKVLIANRIGSIWTQAATIGLESISTPMAWLALISYSLQIYFDFYGYSLMAKGLGYIVGFEFPDNFKNPYLSRTVAEFWRRWPITLGSWFREIPKTYVKKQAYQVSNLICLYSHSNSLPQCLIERFCFFETFRIKPNIFVFQFHQNRYIIFL